MVMWNRRRCIPYALWLTDPWASAINKKEQRWNVDCGLTYSCLFSSCYSFKMERYPCRTACCKLGKKKKRGTKQWCFRLFKGARNAVLSLHTQCWQLVVKEGPHQQHLCDKYCSSSITNWETSTNLLLHASTFPSFEKLSWKSCCLAKW